MRIVANAFVFIKYTGNLIIRFEKAFSDRSFDGRRFSADFARHSKIRKAG